MATLEERIYDANRAKEVLENEAFIQAFADIEAELIEQWKTSPARDLEGREKLWSYLFMLRKLKSNLETSLQTGRLAMIEVEHKKSLKDKIAGIASYLR